MTLKFAVLGDSIAYGQGASEPDDTIGARLAAALNQSGHAAELKVFAVPRARSDALAGQVQLAVNWGSRLALIIVGANDLTHFVPTQQAARQLGAAVRALRTAGTQVVVSPAPDLSVVPWVPAQMRELVKNASAALRRAQTDAAFTAGARVVDLGRAMSVGLRFRRHHVLRRPISSLERGLRGHRRRSAARRGGSCGVGRRSIQLIDSGAHAEQVHDIPGHATFLVIVTSPNSTPPFYVHQVRKVNRSRSTSWRPARRTGWVLVVAVLGIAGVVLAVLGPATDRRLTEGVGENIGDSSFYSASQPFPAGVPGAVVRTERLPSAPEGTTAWRVLYHSTNATGGDIVTSGVVIEPNRDRSADNRVVVGWGHPTTGAVARCGPSRSVDPFILIEGLDSLLAAGYVVAAPDYPGLGLPGQSSYLIGSSEGNSVLDAVRAARTLTAAGPDVLLWGHSQGGHAVLFAAQNARSYAPELHVRAIAVAAPAADLGALLDDHRTDIAGVTLGSYSYAAYQSAYGATTPGLSLGSDPDPGWRRGHAVDGLAVPHRPALRPARYRCTTGRPIHPQRPGDHPALVDPTHREHSWRRPPRGSAAGGPGPSGHPGATRGDRRIRRR